MTETEKIYRHIYPNTLWGIISDFNTQYQDYKEFSETNPEDIGDSDKEDMKFWLTELKIALQIYVNYNYCNEKQLALADFYGIKKTNS